ncbi:MAG: hypothetical protein KC486_02435, partial [Myxococcales bacterium]|nr:hypothetical protein [Myxococcales bacterium]
MLVLVDVLVLVLVVVVASPLVHVALTPTVVASAPEHATADETTRPSPQDMRRACIHRCYRRRCGAA